MRATWSKPRTIRLALVAIGALAALAIIAWRLWPAGLTIGVEGRRVVEIAGPRLQAVPFTAGDALAVRVAAATATAAGFRYDLRYMAYGPGDYDLGEFLIDDDGRHPDNLPRLPVRVASVLPAGHAGELFNTPTEPIELHTNYRWGMAIVWSCWAALLVPLLIYGRPRAERTPPRPAPPTLLERVTALLRRAERSPLPAAEQAELERLLLAFWVDRLQLADDTAAGLWAQARRHPRAGPQLGRIEAWLHRRVPAADDRLAGELLAELSDEAARRRAGGPR